MMWQRIAVLTALYLSVATLVVAPVRADGGEADGDYTPPKATGALFYETFSESWSERWVISKDGKFNEGRWEVTSDSPEERAIAGDQGLFIKEAAKHHAIVAPFAQTFDNTGKDLVVQYEVRLHANLDCGGAYLKLLSSEKFDADAFSNETPYIIMFGPDRCGTTDKVHFIFRHYNPVSKTWEEKHMTQAPPIKNDRMTHLYTLVVRKDNSFQVLIDGEVAREGSLLKDFDPPVVPPREIDDPTDSMPKDWVLEAEIDDPTATKPDDWDEDAPATILDMEATKPDGWNDNGEANIPDPDATKPEDWDDEADGEWEPPLVPNPACSVGCGEWERPMKPNPAYKGKWRAPRIPNPAYKGEWKPRQIPNPNFYEDLQPSNFAPMAAVGIEVWTMSSNVEFDNFYIGHDVRAAQSFADATFGVKHAKEMESQPAQPTMVDDLVTRAQQLYEDSPALAVIGACLLVLLLLFILSWSCASSSDHGHAHAAAAATTAAAAADADDAKAEPEAPATETEPANPPAAAAAATDGARQRKTKSKARKD